MHQEIEPSPTSTHLQPAGATAMDRVLDQRTAERMAGGFSANTRRAYRVHLDRYQKWCQEQDRTPYPATPQTMAGWVSGLRDMGLSPSSVEVALSAVRSEHSRRGLAVNTEGARLVLRQHRKSWAENGGRVRQAAAITTQQLRLMIDQAPAERLAGLRDRALLTLGYAGMFRRSELARLNLEDVRGCDEGLEVFLSQSKTDRDAHGTIVKIPYGTRRDTCPVRSVLAWMQALESEGVVGGALLRGVDRHDRISGTPGAAGTPSGRMSPESVGNAVKRLARRAGLEGVSGHSLRAGPATTAILSGADRSDVAQQGRWGPNSTAMERYIRAGQGWERNAARHLGL